MNVRAALLLPGEELPRPDVVELPEPKADQVLVHVRASGLNPMDLLIADGRHHSIRPRRPYVPGFEGVGTIAGRPGERVWWLGSTGSFAERAVVRSDRLVAVPDGLPDDLAAAVGVAGIAAWLSIVERAALVPGEHVLILGTSGSVGRIAVQVARLRGAGRVVGAARRHPAPDLLALLDDFVVLPREPDRAALETLAADFATAAPRGFDVIIDPIFGPPATAAVRAAAPGARVVALGQTAGSSIEVTGALIERHLVLLGHRNSTTPLPVRAAAYQAVAEHARDGDLVLPRVVYPLDRIGDAWAAQRSSPGQKLVVVP